MGILSNIVESLSGSERKLLVLLGLIASKKIKTRGESEIQDYVSEKYGKVDRALRNKLEKTAMSRDFQNLVRNSVGMMNSRGLTKGDILKRVNKVNNNLQKMIVPDPSKETFEPDEQEFVVYACPSCGFTVDADKDLPPSKLKCRLCETKMVGVKREDFQDKDNFDGFNEMDETEDPPHKPRVKPSK